MAEKKEFKGIWVPVEILLNKDLTHWERFFIMEISQLTSLEKGCIASNNHFATKFQLKRSAVSRIINSLKRKGYINVDIKNRNYDRKITINKMLMLDKTNNKMLSTNNKMLLKPITKCVESKEKNKVIKNKEKNKEYTSFQNKYNNFAKNNNIKQIKLLTKTRKQKLKARLKEDEFNFDKILDSASKQSFLFGENDRGWQMDFDWLIKNDSNYIKIIEERYKKNEKPEVPNVLNRIKRIGE